MLALNKILLVEDDPDIRTVVKFALERTDEFKIKYCASGQEAIQEAPGFKPDLILLDVMMPEMDGTETYQALRKLPEIRETPIIFMTAKTETNELDQFKKLGALDVIIKPFNVITLADDLKTIWKKHGGQI